MRSMHKSTQVSIQSIMGKMAHFETSWSQYGDLFQDFGAPATSRTHYNILDLVCFHVNQKHLN